MISELLGRKDIEEKIISVLKKTIESGKEQGFSFCIDGGITAGTVSGGERSSVHTEGGCKGKVVGALHTHTVLTSTDDILPSPSDVMKGIKGFDFFCVGGFKGNAGIVRCFDKRNIERELRNIVKAKKGLLSEENMHTPSKMMIIYMIKDKNYLEKHSFKKSFTI